MCSLPPRAVTPPCLNLSVVQRYRYLHVLDPDASLPSLGKGGHPDQRRAHGHQHSRRVHVPAAGHGRGVPGGGQIFHRLRARGRYR